MSEPLPGLTVPTGLTDQQLGRLRTLVQAGHQPRVRLLDCAGQVAGQRGTVVSIGQPDGDVAEFIDVRMDRDRDILPFAPHELRLLTVLPSQDVVGDGLGAVPMVWGRGWSASQVTRRIAEG